MDEVAPMFDASTGVAAANASITVRGIPSYHSDGNTRNSAERNNSMISGGDLLPRYSIEPLVQAAKTKSLRGPSPAIFRGTGLPAVCHAFSIVAMPFSELN